MRTWWTISPVFNCDTLNSGQITNYNSLGESMAETTQGTYWLCHDMTRTQILNCRQSCKVQIADLWCSNQPNCNSSGWCAVKPVTMVFVLRWLCGEQCTENCVQCVGKIVCEYKSHHLGCMFTLDITRKSDTTCQFIAKYLEPIPIIDYHPVQNQVHCLRHILNFCIKDFLWGYDVETFESAIAFCDKYQ